MKCQVWNCPNGASVRCDAGFRYCEAHKSHDHSDGSKAKRAILRPIRPDGNSARRRLPA